MDWIDHGVKYFIPWIDSKAYHVIARGLCTISRPSVVCLPSVCLSSVTFVHSTQPVKIFGNVFTPFGTLAMR